jgi:hypothetical protein
MALRNLILHNFGLKVFALLLASLIWYSIAIKIDKGIRQLSSPLAFQSSRVFQRHALGVLSAGRPALGYQLDPEEVTVTVVGDTRAIDGLVPGDLQAYVDVRGYPGAGPSTNVVFVHAPLGVFVEEVDPAAVRVQRLAP